MYIKQAAKQNIKVNLHIVGVQKAGTTALAHFLSQHPDICLVDGKEAHVFDQPDFYETEDKKAFAEGAGDEGANCKCDDKGDE